MMITFWEDFGMLRWLWNNIATVLICAVLLAAVAAIVATMIQNRKRGKSACGCGCADCALKGSCRGRK
ncbi:MAG: FeoB-associated Cys-rich membrane protein [Clostridia bacterium]